MKQAVKIIGSLIIGAAFGFGIATLFVILTTDLTQQEFLGKFNNVQLLEMAGVVLFSVLSFLLALPLQIIFHEGGHLLAGLLTGYKFVSFRILNITFINSGGKIAVKRFKIAGTGGQCLLSPSEKPVEEINATWYNAGGFLANLLLSGGALYLSVLYDAALAKTFLFIFALTGIFFAILNGIPFKVGGIPNDGYNLKMLHNNLESRKAHDMLVEAYANKDKIAPLFVNEIICELIYTSLATGETEKARELYTGDIEKYISQHRKVMSSKERIMSVARLSFGMPENAVKPTFAPENLAPL